MVKLLTVIRGTFQSASHSENTQFILIMQSCILFFDHYNICVDGVYNILLSVYSIVGFVNI